MIKIKFQKIGILVLFIFIVLTAFFSVAYADRNVPAMPEVQGLSTSTGMNVQGTITETDGGAWSVNANGIPLSGADPILAKYPGWTSSGWGSYQNFLDNWDFWLLGESNPSSLHLQDMLNAFMADGGAVVGNPSNSDIQNLINWLQNQGSPLTPPLQDQEVQYTTGYNDQIMAVSGQSTFSKTMALSTANKIADQSNIKADTSLQYIATDTGRATRTEDLLLDGTSQASDTSIAILCPFASTASAVIPAYCNIEQAGSSMDTTLTSVVTHADDRFVGTDSSFPVVLNYNINAQGITLPGGTSSPMIGSVSAYLKLHVQEARNISSIPDIVNNIGYPDAIITQSPQKSEDLVYSETSSASGLVNHFTKTMSYQSGLNLI
ncbi:MAG TPA: hypothetical protein VMC42_00445 [Methanoregulaceae archaeon]|nr:hypothetical protein [Methanoregulaceae archaeon]